MAGDRFAEAYDEDPAPTGADDLRDQLDRFLESEIEVGSFPGVSYVVGNSEGIVAENALGHAVVKPARLRATVDTIWDLASLTKPLITGTLALQAVAAGSISLLERVSTYLPELGETEKRNMTVLDLLTHRGGFQAWYPLYTQGLGDAAYLEEIRHRPLRYLPGTRVIYSCLGFILLHQIIERVAGRPVEEIAAAEIFEPLGITSAGFNLPDRLKTRIAATEWGNANERQMVYRRGLEFDRFRDYLIWGEVNDGNAYYMGGVAGNAGLFGTARDVFAIAKTYLDGRETLLPEEIVAQSRRNYTMGLEENRGLAWQLQTPRGDHPTSMLSEGTFGHTGFTGTSVYVDPERDLIMVILTNRLHPTCKPLNTQYIRRMFHQIVVDWWG